MQSLGDVVVLQVQVTGRKGNLSSFCLRFNGKLRFSACKGTNLWSQLLYHVVAWFVQEQVLLLPYDDVRVPIQVCNLDVTAIWIENRDVSNVHPKVHNLACDQFPRNWTQ